MNRRSIGDGLDNDCDGDVDLDDLGCIECIDKGMDDTCEALADPADPKT